MKKITLLLTALLALLTLAIGVYVIRERVPAPEDTVMEFQRSFNRYDLKGMADCLESSKAGMLNRLLDLESDSHRIRLGTWASALQMGIKLLPVLSSGAISKDDLPKLELKIHDVYQKNDYAEVYVKGILTSGENWCSFERTVVLTLENGQWRIDGLARNEE